MDGCGGECSPLSGGQTYALTRTHAHAHMYLPTRTHTHAHKYRRELDEDMVAPIVNNRNASLAVGRPLVTIVLAVGQLLVIILMAVGEPLVIIALHGDW